MNLEKMLKEWGDGVGLSADQVAPMVTIVESALADKETAVTVALTEKHQAEIDRVREEMQENVAVLEEQHRLEQERLIESLAEYADYTASKYIADNEARLVEAEEYAHLKEQVEAIKTAVVALDIGVQVDNRLALQEAENKLLQEKVAELETQLEHDKRKAIVESAIADLAETQKEKVIKLVETATANGFTGNYQSLVENFVEMITAKPAKPLNEDTNPQTKDEDKTAISKYANFIKTRG